MSTVAAPPAARRGFGRSALVAGLVRLGRAPAALGAAVAGNALVQALLVLPDPQVGATWGFAAAAAASTAALLLAWAAVTATALGAADGRVGPGLAVRLTRAHLLRVVAWALALVVAFGVGLALWTLPGLLVAAATPYLLLAAADGARNPLAVNVSVVAARPVRWAVTAVLAGLVLLVVWVLSALSGFFVRGAPSAFLTWLAGGAVAAWLTGAWAAVYREVRPAGG